MGFSFFVQTGDWTLLANMSTLKFVRSNLLFLLDVYSWCEHTCNIQIMLMKNSCLKLHTSLFIIQLLQYNCYHTTATILLLQYFKNTSLTTTIQIALNINTSTMETRKKIAICSFKTFLLSRAFSPSITFRFRIKPGIIAMDLWHIWGSLQLKYEHYTLLKNKKHLEDILWRFFK